MARTHILEPHQVAARLAARRGARELALTGEGTEFLFYSSLRGTRYEGYRIPRMRVYNTSNNPQIPASSLQIKELNCSIWAQQHGLPSARAIDLVDQDGYPVLITEVIEDDGSPVDAHALGSLLASLHELPPLAFDEEGSQAGTIYATVAQRIADRYAKLARQHAMPALPSADVLRALLERSLHRRSLLHLDIRRQNVRVLAGMPLAIFDWSNALCAAPEMELARIEEYAAIAENGLDSERLRTAYTGNGGSFDDTSAAWTVLRLDAAVMLAGVFNSVAPNSNREQLFLARSRALLENLGSSL
ncbi:MULTISPECIES: phosphotransferase [Micrococcaceae]|uniref:phosphotransferase family protein n=1 Tax=Micrococcaceae TaxID=1268 RepID=UPI000CFC328E|nr:MULTISPECIES: phosphotransferase [unclassified Arthrobacter]PQZ88297.1 hypothetical protein CQ016_06015 [Arthrobacter sp. MYb222]PRB76839.1 hypothetical protein CQ012_07485 [Arthrobacter sp. MYb214]TDU30282.1 hypothetical protein EDF61_101241 [Arthrobacter sp. JUb115]